MKFLIHYISLERFCLFVKQKEDYNYVGFPSHSYTPLSACLMRRGDFLEVVRKGVVLTPLFPWRLRVHSKLLTVNGLVRSTVNVAVSVDLKMEAVPLCICVEVHQVISIPPAGIQQRRGVGKGEGSLQATEYQQCVPQAAVGTGLQHGSPFLAVGRYLQLDTPLCFSLSLGRLWLECESSDRFLSFLQRLIKGSKVTSHRKNFSTSLIFVKATF